MTWLATLATAVLGAVLGGAGTFGLAFLWVEWYRIPAREGQSGYFIVFMTLLGIVLGFVVGAITSRVVVAVKPDGAWFVLGLLYAAGVAIALLVATMAVSWAMAPPAER